MDRIRYIAPERIVLLGGKEVVSDDVRAQLETVAPVERIGGRNRYETASLVAAQMPIGAVTDDVVAEIEALEIEVEVPPER